MRRGLVSGWSATPPSQGAEPRRSPVLGFSICLHPLMQNNHVRQVNMWGVFLGFSHTAHPQGRSPFWEFPSIYLNTLQCRKTKFNVVTHMMSWRVLWDHPRSHPTGRPQCSPFLWFSIYAYTL